MKIQMRITFEFKKVSIVIVIFLMGQIANAAQPEGFDFAVPADANYAEGQLLVRFAPKSKGVQRSITEKNQIISSLGGGTLERNYKIVPGLSLVKLPPNVNVAEALIIYNNTEGILHAQPDYILKALSTFPDDPWGPNSVDGGEQWGLHNIGQSGGTPGADIDAPDIYFPNFKEWAQKYHRSGNPLFVPEVGRGSENPANALYAIGHHDAMGFSPFAIELLVKPDCELAQAYDVLSQLSPLILKNQGKGKIEGVVVDVDNQTKEVKLGDWMFNVKLDAGWKKAIPPGMMSGCIIISLESDEFIIAGKGMVITFDTSSPGDQTAGIGSIQEGKFINGQWKTDLWLNGDQSHQGRHLRLPNERYNIQIIKLYRYR